MSRALISIPASVSAGEIFEVKVLIAHPMETGFRTGASGRILERDIITDFSCLFENEEVFRAQFSPAIAANPFISFSMRVKKPGTFRFQWRGDHGFEADEERQVELK